MNSASSSPVESSLLIWLLAAAMLLLALYVSLGWLRLVRARESLRMRLKGVVGAGLLMGTQLCAGIVLILAGEALAFPLGYRAADAVLLWLGALAGGLVLCLLIDRCRRWWLLAGCGVLLGLMAVGLQIGWLEAVGFRPGINWQTEFVALAASVAVVTSAGGLALAFSEFTRSGARRTLWEVGAAVLVALGLMAAQELLLVAAGLQVQVGSVFRGEIPGTVLSLVLGLLMPLLLAAMAIDLAWRRSNERRSKRRRSTFQGTNRPVGPDGVPRRRRRQRMRTL